MKPRSSPPFSWTVRATGGVVVLGLAAGCTSTPDYFPPCVNPYDMSACPADDGGADGDAPASAIDGESEAGASDAAASDDDATESASDGDAAIATDDAGGGVAADD